MSIAEYADRLVDLSVFEGVTASGEATIALDIFDGGDMCTGIQGLAQAFLTRFLMEKGSDPVDTDAGTLFMSELRCGTILDDHDVENLFALAVVDLKIQLGSEAIESVNDDDVLATATLVDYSLSTNSLEMTVRVTSEAGESRDVILPLDVPIVR